MLGEPKTVSITLWEDVGGVHVQGLYSDEAGMIEYKEGQLSDIFTFLAARPII